MTSLSTNLFWNIERYPHFYSENNQWYESGWVYDLETEKYIRYTISRKEQSDGIWESLSYNEFKFKILPNTSRELQDWFLGFSFLRCNNDVWIFQEEELYRYGGFTEDSFGKPKIEKMEVKKTDAPQIVQNWLKTL